MWRSLVRLPPPHENVAQAVFGLRLDDSKSLDD